MVTKHYSKNAGYRVVTLTGSGSVVESYHTTEQAAHNALRIYKGQAINRYAIQRVQKDGRWDVIYQH